MPAFSGLNRNTKANRGVTPVFAKPQEPGDIVPPVEVTQPAPAEPKTKRPMGAYSMGGRPMPIHSQREG